MTLKGSLNVIENVAIR